MTAVRLAVGSNNGTLRRSLSREHPPPYPSLLVSYYYRKLFEPERFAYRDWVMDSGAFSAHVSGVEIDLDVYTGYAKDLLASDPTLTEVFALDVIGDWRASMKNTEAMWARGVPAIPTFHMGEPWEVLVGMSRDYPKIALGGVVGLPAPARLRWVNQCFARVWPKRIHGLGILATTIINAVPFHSVDATNWQIGPTRFGRWSRFGDMSVRGYVDLRSEVLHFINIENRLRALWAKEMAELDALPPLPRLV